VEVEKCDKNASCTANDIKLFNTNVVFDRTGCIVSKYRKFNLFGEPLMNVPNSPEMAIFDTDFGITFGHIVSYDLLFKSPAYDLIKTKSISHILFPSQWISETPFLVSIQTQQSYAYRNNIVLLSSGTNSPSNYNTGSGIYVGKYGAIDSVISYRDDTKMMVARVPKDLTDTDFSPDRQNVNHFSPLEMDHMKTLSFNPNFTYPLQEFLIIHADGIDCEFSANYTQLETANGNLGFTYRYAVFYGIRDVAHIRKIGEAYCAIIACTSDDPQTCGGKFSNSEKLTPSFSFRSIKITTTIKVQDDPNNYLMMPTSLDFSLCPLDVENFNFSYTSESNNEGMQNYVIQSTNELNNFQTFGIYGRIFNLDDIEHDSLKEQSGDFENVEIISTTLKSDETLQEYMTTDSSNDNIVLTSISTKFNKIVDDTDEKNIALKMTIYVCLMVVLCIVAAFLVYRKLKNPYDHPLVVMRRKSEMIH
jgi:hypothetical protein